MPPRPLRFLQAVLPSLDHVPHSPSKRLPSEVWYAAPREAFRRAIDAAIHHKVDFLLLFSTPDDPSTVELENVLGLQAMLELQRQQRRLAESGIGLCLVTDSPELGWKRMASSQVELLVPAELPRQLNLPGRISVEFVTHRNVRPSEEYGYAANGESYTVGLTTGEETWEPRSTPPYIAAGSIDRNTEETPAGVRHASGLLQGAHRRESGPHGASLVTLTGAAPKIEFVPTAAVRLESQQLRVGASEPLEDLALRMTERIVELKPLPGEQAWSVDWLLEVENPSHALLLSRGARQDLLSLLPEELTDVPVYHDVRVERTAARFAEDDPLAREFALAVNTVQRQLETAGGRLEILGLPPESRQARQIMALVQQADADSVIRRMRTLTGAMTTATWTFETNLDATGLGPEELDRA